MIYTKHILAVLVILLLSGCAGLPLPGFGAPTETPLPPTLTLVPVSTETPVLTATPSPTITITPTPTIFLTPTDVPENYLLAESGYDIAEVRLSLEEQLAGAVVDFRTVDYPLRIWRSP